MGLSVEHLPKSSRELVRQTGLAKERGDSVAFGALTK
jgi:hypothetical protein